MYLREMGRNGKKDGIMYEDLFSFHPACTAVTILRRLIKSAFETCYCVLEKKCVQNGGKKLKV
jgi:hypothetical protein